MPVVTAPIDRVTVYRNGALVVRKGEGQGPVEVAGLPLLFASDSLRVRPGRGMVTDLQETVRLESRPAPVPVDTKERDELKARIADLDDALHSHNAMAEALGALMPQPPDPRRAPDTIDVSRHLELMAFGRHSASALRARMEELTQQRAELAEALRLVEARTAGDTSAPVVTRGCSFTLAEGTAFELEYFVAAARWVPSYALHLSLGTAPSATGAPEGRSARSRLVCGALIAQATGEDWSGVRVAVSTADLMRETNLPTLSSWRMGRAQPARHRAWRPLPTDLQGLFAGYDLGVQGQRTRAGGVPPAPPAPSGSANSGFERASTDEILSFQQRSAPGAPADEEDVAAPEEREEPKAKKAAPQRPSAPRPMPPASAPAMMAETVSMSLDAASPEEFGAALSRGGGVGGLARLRKDAPEVVRVAEELPERWRTAYMRMAGPAESMRGQLLPLSASLRLMWMLDAHDVDDSARAELGRALRAMNQAAQRLAHAPLPAMTSALLGTHFFAVFEAQDRTDIPADGSFYRVEVRRDEGPAALEHRCVPRESSDVWRFCKLSLTGVPLPAGPLAVYEDGVFKVNARLDTSGSTQKSIDINLGVDPDVRVVGRVVQTQQAEKGLVGQTSRVEHRVKLELRSTRPQPVDIVVYERLPVPMDNVKDVTVSLLEEKPPARKTQRDAAGNEMPGGMEWRCSLMPGELLTIQHAYAVDLPAKAELEGGNRRE